MNSNRKLRIIDLDFTIVNGNTTFDFLSCTTPRKYYIFSRILRPAIFLNRLFKTDVYKALLVLFCIKGEPKELLRKYSRLYYCYATKKEGYVNYKLIKCISNTRKKAILVTASLDFIAENFKKLGFDAVISSKTYYKKGNFHYFSDLYGKKHKVVQFLSRHYDLITVIEDSPEKEYYAIQNVRVICAPKKRS